jgi:hypothetical protein
MKKTVLQFEDHDLWKPTCPDIYIKKEWEEYDWPCAINNLYGEWLYNWKWAMMEAEFLWKIIPTDEEFDELLKTKYDMPNVVFAGYCSSGGSCDNRGSGAVYWSSTVYAPSPTVSWSRGLGYSYASVGRNTNAQTFDFSVRCLKDSSDSSSSSTLSENQKTEVKIIVHKELQEMIEILKKEYFTQ